MSSDSIGDLPTERRLLADGVLRLEQDGSVLVISLNRPEARNAMNLEMAQCLGDAVELFTARNDLRVAVLRGEGRAFCVGQDLKALSAGEQLHLDHHPQWGFGGFVGHFTPKPVIAAIHGYALGGGLELALACDLIVAAASTRLGLPEVRHGLFAAGGGIPRLAQQIPMRLAMRIALTGEQFDSEQAATWGLVNKVVPDAALDREAMGLARVIAENAPVAVRATKRLMHETAHVSAFEPSTWERIEPEIARVFLSDDAAEGASAFVEKRQPQWRGR